MEVTIPHDLDIDEVRRRLRENSDQIGAGIPGGMAEVTTSWPSEDRMDMNIEAMGQMIEGFVAIEEARVVFNIELPMALAFVKPMVENTIRQQGQRLLAPAKD